MGVHFTKPRPSGSGETTTCSDAQYFQAGQRAADVHDGVHPAHFVQVDVLNAGPVNGRLRLADALEDPDGSILD
ncbi:MAG: hypothetical protein U1F77_16220 [Kiritimatiellia bacterium]